MTPLEHMARVLQVGEQLMDTNSPFYPWPSRKQLADERERDRRELERERYISKFEGLFSDIEVALVGLQVLAQYDTAAQEAHDRLRDALSDARYTIKSNAE